jgi:hypothetical protein
MEEGLKSIERADIAYAADGALGKYNGPERRRRYTEVRTGVPLEPRSPSCLVQLRVNRGKARSRGP